MVFSGVIPDVNCTKWRQCALQFLKEIKSASFAKNSFVFCGSQSISNVYYVFRRFARVVSSNNFHSMNWIFRRSARVASCNNFHLMYWFFRRSARVVSFNNFRFSFSIRTWTCRRQLIISKWMEYGDDWLFLRRFDSDFKTKVIVSWVMRGNTNLL